MTLRKTGSALLCVLIVLLFCITTATTPGVAFANTAAGSSVILDLKKDSEFNVENYPAVDNDYSLHVIQIGESIDEDLFIYVYRPSGRSDMKATSINISKTIGDDIEFENYAVSFINSYNDVLDKYRVVDFRVDNSKVVRYYTISSIFRMWNEAIDESAPEGNTISETSFEVGQKWQATTKKNGDVEYAMTHVETITITNKYLGFVRYSNGFFLSQSSCDAHYVAFSTDKRIDQLLEADLEYQSHHYKKEWWFIFPSTKTDNYKKNLVTLTYTDTASNPADGLFAKKYVWNRIESVSKFIENENLTDDAKSKLKNKQWVLRFAETPYSYISNGNHSIEDKDVVSEVTILRLKFITSGRTYNIGAVDNKQSDIVTIPDNNNTLEMEDPAKWVGDQIASFFTDNWKWIVVALASVVGIVIAVFVVKAIWSRPKVTVVNQTSNTRSKKHGKKH